MRYSLARCSSFCLLPFYLPLSSSTHSVVTQAEIVIEELIEHGRCSIERVVARATEWVIRYRGASAPITGTSEIERREGGGCLSLLIEERARAILRQKFDQLISNHYIIQADPPARAPPASVKSLYLPLSDVSLPSTAY